MAKTDRNSVSESQKRGGHLAGYYKNTEQLMPPSSLLATTRPFGRYEFLESESDQHNISKKTVKQHTYISNF